MSRWITRPQTVWCIASAAVDLALRPIIVAAVVAVAVTRGLAM